MRKMDAYAIGRSAKCKGDISKVAICAPCLSATLLIYKDLRYGMAIAVYRGVTINRELHVLSVADIASAKIVVLSSDSIAHPATEQGIKVCRVDRVTVNGEPCALRYWHSLGVAGCPLHHVDVQAA